MKTLQPVRKPGWRKTLGTVINNVSRATHVGNYWYWIEVPELANGIEIASLVCPLRYDVIVRQAFLSFYAQHRDLYAADLGSFIRRAKHEPYYIWFMQSEAVRCKQGLRGQIEALESEFVQRIHRAATLYESVTAHGFLSDHPIILKTAEHLLPPTADKTAPPTGKYVSAQYFLADGCHRLALLMMLGYTVLPASCFRIKCFRVFSPFDSTSLLVRHLALDPATYFTFLSSYYCTPSKFDRKDDFLAYVRQHKSQYIQEVLSIMRVDGFDL